MKCLRWITSLAIVSTLAASACRQQSASDQVRPVAGSAGARTETPVDRLLPGELAQSAQQVFGFPIPTGMQIERAYPDAVHLVGEVTVHGVAEYVRKHADVGAPELTSTVLRFERGVIRAQGGQRQYRFDISQRGRLVQLLIQDVTPPPVQPGLTEEERWRQAGLKPNGSPLNVSELR